MKLENLKNANIATKFSMKKLENGLKVIRYLSKFFDLSKYQVVFSKFDPEVSKVDPLKMLQFLKPITFFNLSTTKSDQFFIDLILTFKNRIWTIKSDFRKDQIILINKYLMSFKSFSRF